MTTKAMQRLAVKREGEARRLRQEIMHHLWVDFPQHCVALGDAQLRVATEIIIERAARHGLTSGSTVLPYSSLMLFMGSYFDEDPQVKWAGDLLRKTASDSRASAVGQLMARTADELAKVAGDEGEHYRRALMWARSKQLDGLRADYAVSGEAGLRRCLLALYQSKFVELGEGKVSRLLAEARRAAKRDGLGCPEGVMVYAALMFLLGSSFGRDPFYPWAGEALAQARNMDNPPASTELVHAAAIRELDRYLSLDRVMRRG